jgi:hypothetical protein
VATDTLKKKAIYWIEDLETGTTIGPVLNYKDACTYSAWLEDSDSDWSCVINKYFVSFDAKVKDSFDNYVKWEESDGESEDEPFGYGFRQKIADLKKDLTLKQSQVLQYMLDLREKYGGYE